MVPLVLTHSQMGKMKSSAGWVMFKEPKGTLTSHAQVTRKGVREVIFGCRQTHRHVRLGENLCTQDHGVFYPQRPTNKVLGPGADLSIHFGKIWGTEPTFPYPLGSPKRSTQSSMCHQPTQGTFIADQFLMDCLDNLLSPRTSLHLGVRHFGHGRQWKLICPSCRGRSTPASSSPQ